jgi:hypothetical protein
MGFAPVKPLNRFFKFLRLFSFTPHPHYFFCFFTTRAGSLRCLSASRRSRSGRPSRHRGSRTWWRPSPPSEFKTPRLVLRPPRHLALLAAVKHPPASAAAAELAVAGLREATPVAPAALLHLGLLTLVRAPVQQDGKVEGLRAGASGCDATPFKRHTPTRSQRSAGRICCSPSSISALQWRKTSGSTIFSVMAW